MRHTLGISPCPNDTFMFHAILERHLGMRGFELDVELLDVQELNRRATEGEISFSKVSCYAAAALEERYEVLAAGAALGFGVGPLVLARRGAPALGPGARVLTPGSLTTAGVLFRRYFPSARRSRDVVFSEIMPALERGEADYGVVIHEGRFTYAQRGLELIADLGERWEQEFRLPLPLGCIVASRSIAEGTRQEFGRLVRDSVEYAFANRAETLATMRRHAQELDEAVIWSHVDLYVNKWSADLGEDGRRALEIFRDLVRSERRRPN